MPEISTFDLCAIWGSLRERRNHSPEFKAKVAMAAMRGDKEIAEFAQANDHRVVLL